MAFSFSSNLILFLGYFWKQDKIPNIFSRAANLILKKKKKKRNYNKIH